MSNAAIVMGQAASGTWPGTWDLAYAAYSSQSFSISSQETNPKDVFFKSDGTKMYIVGTANDTVYQYDLSTAWDISTASSVGNFSVFTQESVPEGLFFKPDGFKMYVVGSNGDDVNEYDLGTAWIVSTAAYSQLFSVSTQDTVPTDVFFKSDGTKMYILGRNGDDVNEYNLSTAWDVSTASYSQNFSVASQDSNPQGISFKDDGTKMFMVGSTNDTVFEYFLSTAWDISTASYTQNFSVASEDAGPNGIFFKPDGTAFYTIGLGNDKVYKYNVGNT